MKRQQMVRWEVIRGLLSVHFSLYLICKTLAGNSRAIKQWNQTSLWATESVYFSAPLAHWHTMCTVVCLLSTPPLHPPSLSEQCRSTLSRFCPKWHQAGIFRGIKREQIVWIFLSVQTPDATFKFSKHTAKSLWAVSCSWLTDLKDVQKTEDFL